MRLIGYIASVVGTVLLVVVVLLIVFTPPKCEHEESVTIYSFQFENSTASNSIRQYCKTCGNNITRPSLFDGTLENQSYLDLIEEHSDGSEIVPGEYYTVTATVTAGDYDFDKVRINCKVENEDFIVGFSVEFREEFEEQVKSLQKGDEITFRGRFYDEGCGFTDCELILE